MIEFEIHLTISELRSKELPRFEEFCTKIESKPIIIELSSGVNSQQPMISKVLRCSDEVILIESIEGLEEEFERMAYKVVRRKIEVPYWHLNDVEDFFVNQKKYLEWHGKISIDDQKILNNTLSNFDAYLSKNTLKSDPKRKFITMRSNNELSIFRKRIKNLKQDLGKSGVKVLKEELEFCIFDSFVDLDKGWIN